MTTPPAASDLEAAVPAGSAAVAAQQPPAAKVAEEEDPRLPCAFVRKIYGILSLQFVLTAAFFAATCLVRPVARFFAYGPVATFLPAFTFAVILVSPLIVMVPMLENSETKRRRNRVLLALFMPCCSSSIAVSTAVTTVDIAVLLQIIILAVLGLTLFAIWGAKTGHDFSDIYPSLLTSVILTLLYIIIVEIPFALKMVGIAICVLLATLLFSGFVVVICDLEDNKVNGDDYNGDEEDA